MNLSSCVSIVMNISLIIYASIGMYCHVCISSYDCISSHVYISSDGYLEDVQQRPTIGRLDDCYVSQFPIAINTPPWRRDGEGGARGREVKKKWKKGEGGGRNQIFNMKHFRMKSNLLSQVEQRCTYLSLIILRLLLSFSHIILGFLFIDVLVHRRLLCLLFSCNLNVWNRAP